MELLLHLCRSELTTKTVSLLLKTLLAQTEVRDGDVTLTVQQNVLRFEISVNDPHRVKVTESQSQLGQVELDVLLSEHHLLGESREQVTAAEKVQNQVEFAFSLKIERLVYC